MDQISEMQKKDGSEGKDKKSGSDGPEATEGGEAGESGEAMEEEEKVGEATTGEVASTEAPTSGNAESKETAAEDKGAEDFEMVEGGGEDDQFAQEKAVEKGEGNGDDAITGAEQSKEDVAEPMGIFPLYCLFLAYSRISALLLPSLLQITSCLRHMIMCCGSLRMSVSRQFLSFAKIWANIILDEKE